MSKWPLVALSEICEITGGNSAPQGNEPYDNGIMPFVRMRDLGRYHFTSNLDQTDDKLTEHAIQKYRMKIFEPGCILFPRSGSVFLNHRAILGVKASIVSHIGILHKFSDLINVRFLYYFLQTYDMTSLSKKTTGVDSIAFSDVAKIKIPLPPMPEQERIVQLLDEAEALRAARVHANARLEQFVPGLFHEMFGDLTANEKNWPMSKIGEMCSEIYRYPTFYGFEYVEKGIPVIRIGNILENGMVDPDLSNYVYISDDIAQKFPRTKIELNDILMAVRGDGSTGKRIGFVNSKTLVGANMSPNLLRFKANKLTTDSYFLFQMMISADGQRLIESRITRTAKKTITARDLAAIEVPLPPLSLQREFAARAGEARAIQSAQGRSAERVEALYQSMLSRAFAGEL